MGSLSNLYISQSYTSLVHLGNDGPITSVIPGEFIELQDGLGNSLNIELNSNGDVNIGGILSASNIPTDIATQAELNAYTQSTNIRLDNLETTTSSLNTSVSQLNIWSSSAKISIDALNAFTASNSTSQSVGALNQWSASAKIELANLESATSSLQLWSASAKTELSNIEVATASIQSFTASAKVELSNLEITTASLNQFSASAKVELANLEIASSSLQQWSSSAKIQIANLESKSASVDVSIAALNVASSSLQSWSASAKIELANIESTTASLNLATQSLQQQLTNIGIQSGSWVTESETGSFLITASAVSNVITFTKGDATQFNLTVGTDINTGSLVTTSSFNTYTASTNIRLNNLEAATSSYAISSSVAAVDAAQQAQINALIAWTGSVTSSTTIESNGTILGQVNTLNFIGTGANVSVGAGTASITINAGSGSSGTAGNSYTSTFMGSTWVVNHNLNTSVPLVFAYESGSQWVIPAELNVTSPNSVTLVFSSVVSGSVVVVNGGDQTVISDVTNATSAVITHNLNTDWPMVQVYESGSRAQIIPLSVVSDSANQITIGFSTPTSAKVVIKK